MNVATGHYLNIYEDSLYGGGSKDIFIVFNEGNSTPTIDELEEIASIVESELKKDPEGTNLRQVVEDLDLPCVNFGVQVISSIKSPLSLSQKASDIIDKNHTLANEIYQQMDMVYAMEDITTRIENVFEKINVNTLSDDEIKKIVESFKDTLGDNDTFWDAYWGSADYAIEEHMQERKVNMPLEDRVKEAKEKVSEGRLDVSRVEGLARGGII